MKRTLSVLVFAAAAFAQDPAYQTVATAAQIMQAIEKPSMDSLVAMKKAGGPKDENEWKLAKRQAAMIAESAQLLLMGGRPLDQDVWVKSSHALRAAAIDAAKAAESQDFKAWDASLTAMSSGCRSCHTVHRKKPAARQ
ncbi:MAG: hypothetical protein ACRD7E_02355 [Bryobacteraceae bacterium]